jgi:hypothetical protein
MDRAQVARIVRGPTAAAIAGLAFGIILATVLVLLHSARPESLDGAGNWTEDLAVRGSVVTALQLIPFAGIAFLWFMAVVRSQLGQIGDRFFDTVFLGSGLLFVAMLFAAAAVLGSVLALQDAGVALPESGAAQAWALASALLGQFGARMAAVFALSTTTLGVRLRNVPKALTVLGYLTGLMLLLTPPLPRWAQLLFPLWVISLSVLVLVRAGRRPAAEPSSS